MIIVNLIGGLGNQLFQYAIGRSLEINLGHKIKFDISNFEKYSLRECELQNFDIKLEVSSKKDNKAFRGLSNKVLYAIHKNFPRLVAINKLGYYLETSFNFIPNIFSISDDTYVSGYWQSEKYFSNIKAILRDEIKFKSLPFGENAKILSRIEGSNSVSIHIRRGDYVNDTKAQNVHGFCGLDYYIKAMNYIEGVIVEPEYFIFSDDIIWAKQNISTNYKVTFVDINQKCPHEDLRLMLNCKHNIIASSTFSWWAGWLNRNEKKIVISPKKWFSDSRRNTKDLIPEEWLLI